MNQPPAAPSQANDLDARFQRALTWHRQGDWPQALLAYRAVLELAPGHFDALRLLGILQVQQGEHQSAIETLQRALQIDATQADLHFNLGTALHLLRRLDAARLCYLQALQRQPEHHQALYNLGLVLYELHRPAEALAYYDRALQLKPDSIEALCNYGQALQALNQLDGALACYTRALQLQPDLALAHWNSGLCRLLRGEFELGWQHYEWGRVCGQRGPQRIFEAPLWLGEQSLQGKSILLHAEQGLGDTLQFCRYAPLVAALGATVWLEVQAPLQVLLSQLPGVTGVIAQGDALPHFDYHCPLLSLPLAFRTRLETIPSQAAYLHADPDKIARWSTYPASSQQPLIGIAWSGNPTHRHDQLRSIPLAQWAPLFALNARFVCLQTALRDSDHELLQQFKILNPAQDLHDFSDTAALLACIDHVITVDTSIAHLAGALGKPTTLLLPYAADFRWLLERGDSPWYPSLRLIRQSVVGVWDDVIEQACHLPAG